MGLISDELFEVMSMVYGAVETNIWFQSFFFSLLFFMQSLEKSCGGIHINLDPSNEKCLNDLQAYDNVKIIIPNTI